jgi:adenosylcobinamide-GDP ribazoletransferase
LFRRYAIAFQFLTVLPVFPAREFSGRDLARSMAAFPLVGATLGALLAGTHWLLGYRLPPMLEGALLVALLAWVTGGLHLDGVADTVDGIGGGRGVRERALEIMKDSRIGALGASALMLTILLKAAGLGYLPEEMKLAGIFATPAAARGAVVLLAFRSPYARPSGGLGTAYTEHLDPFTLALAVAISGALSLVLGWQGAVAFALVLFYALILKLYFRIRLGGVTGDTLGFAEETGEIVFLLALHALAWKGP